MTTGNELIKVAWIEESIALVTMEDTVSHNRSSVAFSEGLEAAFHQVASDPAARVVILQGYGNYFCCGGSKEDLIRLAEKKRVFTDYTFFDLPLRCPLPVVAAMHGHAIGGGLVLGAYADVIVMAEECLYSTNFMNYGFTPGVGATYILPKKFGAAVAWEMMFTGKNYYGRDLRERGIGANIVKKADVMPKAIDLAREIAGKPAFALRELKSAFRESIATDLAAAIQKELDMHEASFSHPETGDRIRNLYGE